MRSEFSTSSLSSRNVVLFRIPHYLQLQYFIVIFYTVSFTASCNVEFRNFDFLISGKKSNNPVESDALVPSGRPSSAIIPFNLFFRMFVTFQNKLDGKLGKGDQKFSSNAWNWEFPLLKFISYR